MRRILIGALSAAVLVAAQTAAAGGWATAGLSSMPSSPNSGQVSTVEVTVLQHGRTPLEGVKPAVTLRNTETGERKRFAATPSGEPGVYRARVKFPEAGTWRVSVYDGFSQYGGGRAHTFAPVSVRAADPRLGFPVWILALGLGAALVVGSLLLVPRIGRTRVPVTARHS